MKPIPTQSVNQRIEEPERGLSRREARIVQQGDKSSESGRRCRRATGICRAAFEEDPKVIRLGRDVRDRLHKIHKNPIIIDVHQKQKGNELSFSNKRQRCSRTRPWGLKSPA